MALNNNPGENTGIITIPNIIDDDLAEADETIIITLSNPTNATLVMTTYLLIQYCK